MISAKIFAHARVRSTSRRVKNFFHRLVVSRRSPTRNRSKTSESAASDSRSQTELLLENVVDRLRVRLAARHFHHLADEPADRFRIALRIGNLVRIPGDDVIDRSLASLRGSPPTARTGSNQSLAVLPEIVLAVITS